MTSHNCLQVLFHCPRVKTNITRSFLVKCSSFLLSFVRPFIISSSNMVYSSAQPGRRGIAAAAYITWIASGRSWLSPFLYLLPSATIGILRSVSSWLLISGDSYSCSRARPAVRFLVDWPSVFPHASADAAPLNLPKRNALHPSGCRFASSKLESMHSKRAVSYSIGIRREIRNTWYNTPQARHCLLFSRREILCNSLQRLQERKNRARAREKTSIILAHNF